MTSTDGGAQGARGMKEAGDRLVVQMIRHGVVAGGLRRAAREYPEAAKGLLRCADAHSAKVGAFAQRIPADAGCDDLASARMPAPQRR